MFRDLIHTLDLVDLSMSWLITNSIIAYKLSATGGTLSPGKLNRAQDTQPNDALRCHLVDVLVLHSGYGLCSQMTR